MAIKRKTRIDKGVPRLTARDIEAFAWIADGEKLSIDLLTILLARLGGEGRNKVSLTRAYQWIQRHTKGGYVEYRAELAHKPGWVNIKRKGIIACGREYPETDKSIYWYNHVWACNFVRLWLERWLEDQNLPYNLTTERNLRSEAKGYIPDMIVEYADVRATINVELTDKGADRYAKIRDGYKSLAPMHWYFVPRSERAKIERHFDETYRFLVLEDRTLEDGTTFAL